MKQLEVSLNQRSYPIYVEDGLISHGIVDNLSLPPHVAVITNQTVADLYLDKLINALGRDDIKVLLAPDSENAKSIDVYTDLMTDLLSANFNRSSLLIALGGGVIGDLTGFIAATLHRGCRLIQIPTTLLSQVDSSVGGKTAINHSVGKNLIGSFYQPEAVFIDPITLKTLPENEFSAGMAEVIKYGFVSETDFLHWLNTHKEAIKQHDPTTLAEMIHQCCAYKAHVVAMDEREQGQRALLNYGHTFGHAIEQVAGYGEWLHGEAVAVGMLMAMKYAIAHNVCDEQLYEPLEQLLSYFDLPTRLRKPLEVADLMSAMLKDKKNLEQKLRLILPVAAGRSIIETCDDMQAIEDLWYQFGASD